jgi:selenocysteine-specific elongation factor
MIIGTAGHIDHGKTALVRALTGIDTDRLPEEKKRGITIELGFAPLTIPGVGVVSVVDVPGHEAFVRTMVAGAAGVDVALLVVAADEGVMPQTCEHIAILDILGVERAVVALTKCDLVDAAWADMVEQDLSGALAHTSLAGAPCVHVSVVSGVGLQSLRDVLATSVRDIGARRPDDLARVPVDRVFAKAGAGTVVTGTVWSGQLSAGDSVTLLPKGTRARVRALQMHNAAVESVGPANRVAIALAGISTDDVSRGDVVVSDDAWSATQVFRADVSLLQDSRPITARTRVRLHLGTVDVGARIVCAGGALEAGTARSARVVVDTPIAARGGDRFVIRRGAEGTIGGGIVTDALPVRRRTRPFPRIGMNRVERLAHVLSESGASGTPLGALPVRLGGTRLEWRSLVDETTALADIGGHILARDHVDAVCERVVAWLDAYHRQHPSEEGAPLEATRAIVRSPDYVTEHVLARLEDTGTIAVVGARVTRAGWQPKDDPDADVCRVLLQRLEAAGPAPPSVAELQRETPRPVIPLLRRLEREGRVVALAADRFAALTAANALRNEVSRQLRPDRGYRPTELKAVFGVSRQYLMPWLEYFDRRGWSRRDGDERRFVI